MCDAETEVCSNLIGTYVCKCKEELVKGEEGKCVTEDERDGQRQLRKAKKKKKKKKKVAAERGNDREISDEEKRVLYSWYYTLAPLIASYLVYKYWRPNLVTSVGIILFISVSATFGGYS